MSRLVFETAGERANEPGTRPRQGQEYAEQIKEASIQMEQLRQDLVASPGRNSDDRAA